MQYISWIMAIFALLGALDRIFGNKLGLGKEFEKGIMLMGMLVLTMIGMLVLTPFFAWAIQPLTKNMDGLLDPSFFVGILFANDMGGAPLATALSNSEKVGLFNGCIVGSMMGATVSFTLPYALGSVKSDCRKNMLTGLLCGIVTVPVGCFAGGLVLKVPFLSLLVNLLPLFVFSGLIALGLWKIPDVCVKIFNGFGIFMKALITTGLAVAIFRFLTGKQMIPYADSLDNTIGVIINVVCVLSGALPLIHILSKLLRKPLQTLGKKAGINETSVLGLFSMLATSVPVYESMDKMDEKGITLNSAFSVSGAFVFADHLAFVMAFAPVCVPALIVGKLTAGITAVLVAALACRRTGKTKQTT